MNEVTWNDLTGTQQHLMKQDFPYETGHIGLVWRDLISKGLVSSNYFGDVKTIHLTEAGRRLLATASEPQPAVAADGGGAEIPDVFDIDGFQHAIINMDTDLMMGRAITKKRVRDVQKAHEEIVADLEAENARLQRELEAARGALKFYADDENYAIKTWDDDVKASEVQIDKGYIAHNALVKKVQS